MPIAQSPFPKSGVSTLPLSLSLSLKPEMITISEIFSRKWTRKAAGILLSALSLIVFLFLDFLDTVFCILYGFLDEFFEGNASQCYCKNREEQGRTTASGVGEGEVSETLYGRKNIFREMGFLGLLRKRKDDKKRGGGVVVNRWSDCGCDSCVSWQSNGDQKLHVVVREPAEATYEDSRGKRGENVIFLHGFISSSSFWTETVFPNLSEPVRRNYRLFAVDLLGFGRSPKPRNCLYTLKDHLEMIEKSVIHPFQLNSFHLVSHSMGCVIALALAAKYSMHVKSLTLIAPPYFPSIDNDSASLTALKRLAERKLWPPLLFGSSVMSWYEHLGRCVCYLVCRNHRTWEWILRLLTRRRDLHFMIVDLTSHTHHSAWHTMHNVICGGAKLMGEYLETVNKSGARINIIQGDRDQVVPLECSNNVKLKVPVAEVNIIRNADHSTVILGRESEFTRDLERIWVSFADFPSRGEWCLKDGNM
ncbi:hypothetical protein L1049_009108 [Liquidambar formosana]|uniref:AB hydrolase-1 domain-containing protein n=1 Tax=Liquidambar formosana TaxID=63359 RepID=A0AAP0S1X1_LIQFO